MENNNLSRGQWLAVGCPPRRLPGLAPSRGRFGGGSGALRNRLWPPLGPASPAKRPRIQLRIERLTFAQAAQQHSAIHPNPRHPVEIAQRGVPTVPRHRTDCRLSGPAKTPLVRSMSRSSTAGLGAEVSAEVPSLRGLPGRQVRSFPGRIEAVSRDRAPHPP